MEPKQATVLSAALTGFSELSERITVQEFNDLLEKYFEITRSIIKLHKGDLSSFSGEVFIAVFAADGSLTSPELLAMEAVFELRDKVSGFRSERELPDSIHFKAGLSMGEAILGEIGSGENRQVKVMGKAAGYAGRLREFAEEGQVLADGAMERKARERFEFRKLESLGFDLQEDANDEYGIKSDAPAA